MEQFGVFQPVSKISAFTRWFIAEFREVCHWKLARANSTDFTSSYNVFIMTYFILQI
jgi:phosphatidylinositol kinase/protein kinase (PI-3  family)